MRLQTDVANTLAARITLTVQIAIAGIRQKVSFDEIPDTMIMLEKRIPYGLQGTALGGCAATPSAC